MHLLVRTRTTQVLFTICILLCSVVVYTGTEYSPHCSVRLENALEHMRLRSNQPKAKSLEVSPYSVYQSIYGNNKDEEDDDRGSRNKPYDRQRQRPLSNADFEDSIYSNRKPHSLPISRVEVEDMKVRLPQKAVRWVEVDKCRFSTTNRTLDTRLIFPDLTISGKIVLYPTGGKCNMILRLRHAGIEFRTVPMTNGMDESRNSRPTASVRTDSHFAEPGFISVFAHGCQGPTGIKLRQNSKRRFGNNAATGPDMYAGSNDQRRWGKLYNTHRPPYDPRNGLDYKGDSMYRRRHTRETSSEEQPDDVVSFEDDVLHFNDDLNHLEPDARAFAEIFSEKLSMDRYHQNYHNTASYNSNSHTHTEDINNALTKELEQLFSMGVKGLLTTYMQRALQPAIKETLMENMGYTLSYG